GGDDVLIGGWTAFDGGREALWQLMAEWSRVDQTYAQRIDHLQYGGGLNGSQTLNRTTVFDDSAVATFFGGAGDDWFVADLRAARPRPRPRPSRPTWSSAGRPSTTAAARRA